MAIDTEEKRVSTCGFLQPWVLPGLRAGSTGTAWRQAAGHGYADLLPRGFLYFTLDLFGTPLLTSTLPGGSGTALPLTLRDRDDGQGWAVELRQDARGVRLAPILEPPSISGAPLVVLDPQIQAQYVLLHDSMGTPWYVYPATGELTCSTTIPANAVDVTPPGGPYTWWAWYTLTEDVCAVSVTPEGVLQQATPPPAGPGMLAPATLGDAEGQLWHVGIAPDGTLGMTDWPPVLYSQAATCLILNDAQDARWYWRMDPMTRELVCSAVLEPDVIPWQASGELGYLDAADPGGGLRWYIMAAHTHEAEVRHAPNLAQPWGVPAEDCPLFTPDASPWLLRMASDGSLWALQSPVPDIPYGTPILEAREAAEALRHVEGAGSLVTLWAR